MAAVVGGLLAVGTAPASAGAFEGARARDATPTSRVAVLPVQSRSTLPASLQTQLRATIEQGLERAEVEIVSNTLVDGELDGQACDDAQCATTLARAVAATWIMRATVTKLDAVYEVQLAAVDTHGHIIAAAVERCEICGHAEVDELVVDRSAALAAKVMLLQRQAPRLALRSRPSGAAVWIDDRLVGHTPLELEVAAGEHEVRVAVPGHMPQRRRVTAVAGTQETLELTLRGDPAVSRRRRAWLGLGVGSLAAGTTMLGAGIGLVVIDGREYERRCNPDPLGQCSHRYDTQSGGIALMVGGGMLLSTAVVAMIASRRAERRGSLRAARRRLDRGLAHAF
jgi:PEGA domain